MNFEEGGGGVMKLFVLFYRRKDSIGEKMMVSTIPYLPTFGGLNLESSQTCHSEMF